MLGILSLVIPNRAESAVRNLLSVGAPLSPRGRLFRKSRKVGAAYVTLGTSDNKLKARQPPTSRATLLKV